MTTSVAVPAARYRWVVLGICWLAFMVAYMQRLVIGPLAPFLIEDLSLTATQLGSLVSAAAFGYMISLIPAGWLIDRVNARWVLLGGEVLGGIFLIAMTGTQSYLSALLLMALGGLGMGFITPTTTKAVLLWFPLKERATAMGFKQTGLNVAGVIMGSTLPALALALSWRYGFLGIGCLAIAVGIVSFALYRDASPDPATMVGLGSNLPKPSLKALFKRRDIWFLGVAGMFISTVEFAALAYFVLYLQETLLFAVVTAGLFLALMQAGGAVGKPVSGLISDRAFGGRRKNVYILLASVTAVACLIWSFMGQGAPMLLIGLVAVILGMSGISWGGVHLTLVGETAGKELAGRAVGITTVMVQIGNMVGPTVFGMVLDGTGSYRLAWQFLAVMGALGVFFVLFVRESRQKV